MKIDMPFKQSNQNHHFKYVNISLSQTDLFTTIIPIQNGPGSNGNEGVTPFPKVPELDPLPPDVV